MMEPELRHWRGFTVAGVRVRARPGQADLGALWGLLADRDPARLPRLNAARAFGVGFNFDEAAREFDYLAGYEVPDDAVVPGDFQTVAIPGGTYAAFWSTLPGLMDTIHRASHVWLPGSAFRRGDGPEFEVYDERFDPGNPDSPMAFVIPIVPR
jgi:predicted transcriptional regulator YdeE